MALIKRHKQGWACWLTAAGYLALAFVPGFAALPLLADQALQRVLLFALVAGMIALLGGVRSLAPSAVGVRRALREGCLPVLLSLGLCALEVTALLQASAAGEALDLSPTWLPDLVLLALFCATVGLYEEALFRVLLLGGILSRHGRTKNGVVGAVLVSSVVFGALHVTATPSIGVLELAQMLLKTAQTACVGVLFAAVYVRTRSFLGVAALHGLADFLLMAPLALLGELEGTLEGSYVSSGVDVAAVALASTLIVVYVAAVAVYALCAVRAWGLLETTPVPQEGPFEPGWAPVGETPADEKDDGLPVPPPGL